MTLKFALSFAALVLMSGAACAQTAAAVPATTADAKPADASTATQGTCLSLIDKAEKMKDQVSSRQKRMATEEIDMARTAMVRNNVTSCMDHMNTALNDMK